MDIQKSYLSLIIKINRLFYDYNFFIKTIVIFTKNGYKNDQFNQKSQNKDIKILLLIIIKIHIQRIQ